MSAPLPESVVIRLPKTAYLVVLFLLIGAVPVAFAGNTPSSLEDSTASNAVSGVDVSWRLAFFVIPILAALFIARTATVVNHDGMKVRAVFGSRWLPWSSLRGLSMSGRGVYAVLDDGSLRLPCVRIAHLYALAHYSDGVLPEIEQSTPKPAPARRGRR